MQPPKTIHTTNAKPPKIPKPNEKEKNELEEYESDKAEWETDSDGTSYDDGNPYMEKEVKGGRKTLMSIRRNPRRNESAKL